MSNRFLATARNALQETPYEGITDMATLEREKGIRILNGAPSMTGDSDPDGVGLEPWLATIYCAGKTPETGLKFIKYLANFKKDKGEFYEIPPCMLCHHTNTWPFGDMPDGWTYRQIPLHDFQPFKAKPPRYSRHVLMQLSTEQDLPDDETYILSLWGNMYPYRYDLDQIGLDGQFVQMHAGKQEYVRNMRVTDSEKDKKHIQQLLQQILMETPVYLIDATGTPENPFAQWLRSQPTIYAESHSGEEMPATQPEQYG